MSMNQGKLDIVKQEITRLNTDILTISELKWMGMSEFNSDDHYIYYCGQESLSRNGVALIVNKRVQNAVLGCSLTNERMISVYFQGKPFNITVIQVYAPTTSADEAEVDQLVLWRPTKPPKTNTHTHTHKTTKTKMFFSSQETGMRKSNEEVSVSLWGKWGSQEIPGITGKFGLGVQNEAGQRLTEFCPENRLIITNTLFQQHKRWLYT